MKKDMITDLQDMRYLNWARTRMSSGIAGSFLKSYDDSGEKRKYYKLSDFDPLKEITGHECVNEIIVQRLLCHLGIEHLDYTQIHALVKVDGKDYETWLCEPEDFKKPGERKITLEKKVLDVMELSSFRLLVFFKDGKSGIVDMKTLCAEDEHFGNVLRNESLFRNVHVSPGGNGVEWGEERSVPSETLRESGKEADISYEDVISFINLRLCDTAQVTGILNCSRQYVKQLADKGRMVPIREAGNSDLYRRSALEAEG